MRLERQTAAFVPAYKQRRIQRAKSMVVTVTGDASPQTVRLVKAALAQFEARRGSEPGSGPA